MTSSYQPAFPDVRIIGLVHHQWDSKWLTPHHVLTRLGKYFHVVWVSPAHEWREIPKRLKGDSTGDGQIGDMPGFQIYTPEWWLPEFYRFRLLADFTLDQRVRAMPNAYLPSRDAKKSFSTYGIMSLRAPCHRHRSTSVVTTSRMNTRSPQLKSRLTCWRRA